MPAGRPIISINSASLEKERLDHHQHLASLDSSDKACDCPKQEVGVNIPNLNILLQVSLPFTCAGQGRVVILAVAHVITLDKKRFHSYHGMTHNTAAAIWQSGLAR